MPEEIGETISHLKNIKNLTYGDLSISSGELINEDTTNNNIFITTAWSGWGKVSSARAATRLLSTKYKNKSVDLIIFTGVAGAVDKMLNQWDIVIANNLIQHDMNASPIYPKYVVPSINKIYIEVPKNLIQWSEKALNKELKSEKQKGFGRVFTGKIATGDLFISDRNVLSKLSKDIPYLYAVEMEGASVAQVAYQEKVPCLVIRVISDQADNGAALDFEDFLKIYEKRSWHIIKALLQNLKTLRI